MRGEKEDGDIYTVKPLHRLGALLPGLIPLRTMRYQIRLNLNN